MCEEELPNELGKLEIGPIIPQIKLIDTNLPVSLNPFYNTAPKEFCALSETEVLFGDVKCSCRMRRRSESVLDDYSSTEKKSSLGRIEHSIKNQTNFKRKDRKKIILREPILKSVQKYLHPRHLKASGDITNGNIKNTADSDARNNLNKSCPTIQALNLNDSVYSLKMKNEEPSTSCKRESAGISDFGDLIAECQSLLETNFKFDSWNATIASRKKIKTFNVIQSAESRFQESRQCSVNRLHNRVFDDNLNKEGKMRQCGSNNPNTSCSQQARINASTVTARTHTSSVAGATSSCDVTIDELASYFETFVHIPKKMSTMAEMMYI